MEYNKEFITAVGNMMSDLAELYADLGALTTAKELKTYKDFTKKVVVGFAKC